MFSWNRSSIFCFITSCRDIFLEIGFKNVCNLSAFLCSSYCTHEKIKCDRTSLPPRQTLNSFETIQISVPLSDRQTDRQTDNYGRFSTSSARNVFGDLQTPLMPWNLSWVWVKRKYLVFSSWRAFRRQGTLSEAWDSAASTCIQKMI